MQELPYRTPLVMLSCKVYVVIRGKEREEMSGLCCVCMYCKYYEYDSELTKVYWQLTQDEKENTPKIGRCTFGNKICGNAVLSDGSRSDGAQGCNAFSHRGCRDELPFKKYDTFIHKRDGKESFVCWVDQIQYEYAPRMYRIKTESGGGWSEDAETLSNPDKYVKLWEERGDNE